MFKEIPKGKCMTVQGLPCWIPPLGFGTHSDTGELERVDIIKRSQKKDQQFWEPQPLPKDYDDKFIAEQDYQTVDPEYTDPYLDEIREREWHRRIYGVWFYNNGEPVYLTGLMYFFLNYWYLDTGLPDFRIVDLEYFYFWQYAVEDPKSYGIIETRKRRDGKTKRAGCILYEYPSRTTNAWSGIQSMNRDVAGEVYLDDIVVPFKALPEFYIPVYDQSQSDTPKSSLRFFRTAIKGKRANRVMRRVELKSKIDFKDAKPKAYDGKKVHRLLLDESGKVDTDVVKRHIILQPCLLDNKRRIVGKMIVTSTVEQMGLDFRYQDLWEQSNQYKREPDGTTKTGLYRFFIPADRAGSYDEYGYPFVDKERDSILNDRTKVETQSDLIDLIRKFPLSEDEAFKTADSNCLYNWELLNIQLDKISYRDDLTEIGDFSWKDGEKYTEVEWRKSKNGRFEICRGLKMAEINKVVKRNDKFYPNNNFAFTIGVDPYKYDQTVDARRSDCAALVYKKYDITEPHNPFNDAFVCKYKFRAATARMQYEDILKMAWYFGCQVLFERNVDGWMSAFKDWQCEGFLMKLPGEKEYGMYADGQKRTVQSIADYTEAYINEYIGKVLFKDLIKDWLKFNINDTTRTDLAMSAGYTLISSKLKSYKRAVDAGRDVNDYFETYKATA